MGLGLVGFSLFFFSFALSHLFGFSFSYKYYIILFLWVFLIFIFGLDFSQILLICYWFIKLIPLYGARAIDDEYMMCASGCMQCRTNHDEIYSRMQDLVPAGIIPPSWIYLVGMKITIRFDVKQYEFRPVHGAQKYWFSWGFLNISEIGR